MLSQRWIVFMICLGAAAAAFARTSPEEHASHHPGAAAPAGAMAPGAAPSGGSVAPPPGAAPAMAGMGGAAAPGAPAAPGMAGGGMAEMMGKMMTPPPLPGAATMAPAVGGMGGMPAAASPAGCVGANCGAAAATTPIYSSLMTLPSLTPEKRAEIDALASQQINEGVGRLATGSESLDHATQAGDNSSMQQAIGVMREGLDELEAGIAARRVLSEGKAPRNLALDWFKREMNLASPIAREEPRRLVGVTPFHLFTMVLLVGFALAMVAMYFFKMRRAEALFGRLEGGPGKPPPGSSPPLAGTPVPVTPVPPPAAPTPPAETDPPPEKPAPAPTTPAATPAPATPAPPPAETAPPPGESSDASVDPPAETARRRAKP